METSVMYSGSITTVEPTPASIKETQVGCALDVLDRESVRLNEALTVLERRLSHSLRPMEDTPNTSEIRQVMVPLAERISDLGDQFGGYRRFIEAMIDRLEI